MGTVSRIDKGTIKVLIPMDDILKDIKLYYAYTGLNSSDDLEIDVVREIITSVFKAAKEQGETTKIPFCGLIAEALVDSFIEVSDDWNVDQHVFSRPLLARLTATGLAIGQGMERLIQNLLPLNRSTLQILSVKWITKEQLLLEVRL